MRAAVLIAACSLVAPALAHDSWLEKRGGELVMVTGDRYPVGESAAPVRSLPAKGCKAGTCWASLAEHEIVIEDAKVAVYFREIRPPQALADRWAQLREAGVAWKERYTKHARIELGGRAAPPLGLPLEIVPESEAFRVYAHGKPVGGLAVEMVSERSKFGVWQVSDAEGRVAHKPPFAGKWLLRATWLEADGETGWKSRFVTTVVDR
jgi:hypothetical protein